MENRDKNRLAANVAAVVEQIGARLPAAPARAVSAFGTRFFAPVDPEHL